MLRRPEAAWHLPLTCQRHPLRTGFYVPAWYMLWVAARARGKKEARVLVYSVAAP